MSSTVDAVDLDRVKVEPFVCGNDQLENMPPEEANLIRKTIEASKAIARTDLPTQFNIFNPKKELSSLKPEAITAVPSDANGVSEAAASTGIIGPRPKPTLEYHVEGLLRHNGINDTEGMEQFGQAFRNGAAGLQNLRPSDPIEETPDVDMIKQALESTGTIKGVEFPNLAFEVVKLGMAFEKYQTENKLNRYQKEGHEHKATIELLLKLSAKVQKLPTDSAPHPVTPEMKEMIGKLKEKGIDIFPDLGEKFTKEQLVAAKSLIGSHIDQLRLKLQDLFTTKISTTIQFLNSMADVMKNVIRNHDRLMGTISRHSGRQ
jgi:hypothetical protein